MKKTIYHGSEKVIEKPVYGLGKSYNDYGRGFYCTESPELAKEWSVDAARDGFVNAYEIETQGLRIRNLNDGTYTLLHWLAVLLENRTFDLPSVLAREGKTYLTKTFAVDLSDADAVIGYRADDSYFSFAGDFLSGTISYRQLGRAMCLGNLGEQFMVKSPKAFDRLNFVGAGRVDKDEWYARKQLRDRQARRQYFDEVQNKRMRGDVYITDILDEEMKPDDCRLR